jgi:hypothetical protein
MALSFPMGIFEMDSNFRVAIVSYQELGKNQLKVQCVFCPRFLKSTDIAIAFHIRVVESFPRLLKPTFLHWV